MKYLAKAWHPTSDHHPVDNFLRIRCIQGKGDPGYEQDSLIFRIGKGILLPFCPNTGPGYPEWDIRSYTGYLDYYPAIDIRYAGYPARL